MAEHGYFDPQAPFSQPAKPGDPPRPWEGTTLLGQRLPRVDGHARVAGEAVFPSDVILPDMLHAAILHCPHPHAMLASLDAEAARALPGVRDVLTPRDPEAEIPWNHAEGHVRKLLDIHLRHEGQEVAAVAAETPDQAWDACLAIQAVYDLLPAVLDPEKSLAPGAPLVHPSGLEVVDNRVGPAKTHERGDMAKANAPDLTSVSGVFRTATQLHLPLERHGCVARWDNGVLTLWESTQGVFPVQRTVADVLGLPLNKVRVIGGYVGGGFGSKLETSKYAILAALLARRTGRPVKLFLSREQTMLAMGRRPAARMELTLTATRDGALVATRFSALASSGAFPSGGTSLLDWPAKDLYLCPNVQTEIQDVFTHLQPVRPFRAPGYPQGAWAVEQGMDMLARALDMDPVALRLKNIPQVSQAREGQPAYTSTGLKACLEEGAKAFGWAEARQATAAQPPLALPLSLDLARDLDRSASPLRRGVGMAACNWYIGGGFPPATVTLALQADGTAILNMGASDIGTGTKTVMAMVAAEELGLQPDRVLIEHADTATTQYATASGGSKTVPTEAPAVREAAQQLKRQLLDWAAEDLDVKAEALRFEGARIVVAKTPEKFILVKRLTRLKQQQAVMAVGVKKPNPRDKAICPFGAQFCEVEVDVRTGQYRILRFLAAHDSGRVMNRLTYDCQVIGGVTMGIGFGCTEQALLDPDSGKLLTRSLHDYKIPTMLDVAAETASFPLDLPDNLANPAGAKGLGEPVTIPTAPAVANALHDALGLRFPTAPVTPADILRALHAASAPGNAA